MLRIHAVACDDVLKLAAAVEINVLDGIQPTLQLVKHPPQLAVYHGRLRVLDHLPVFKLLIRDDVPCHDVRSLMLVTDCNSDRREL